MQQIDEHLINPIWVSTDVEVLCFFSEYFHRDLFFPPFRFQASHDLANQFRHIKADRPNFQLTCFYAGQIEQIIDQLDHAFSLCFHDRQILALAFVRDRPIQKGSDKAMNRRQRRTQIMGNIGHKILSHLIQAGQRSRHRIEGLPQCSHLIARLDRDALIKVSPGDLEGYPIHFPQWGSDSSGKIGEKEAGNGKRNKRGYLFYGTQ